MIKSYLHVIWRHASLEEIRLVESLTLYRGIKVAFVFFVFFWPRNSAPFLICFIIFQICFSPVFHLKKATSLFQCGLRLLTTLYILLIRVMSVVVKYIRLIIYLVSDGIDGILTFLKFWMLPYNTISIFSNLNEGYWLKTILAVRCAFECLQKRVRVTWFSSKVYWHLLSTGMQWHFSDLQLPHEVIRSSNTAVFMTLISAPT